MDAQELKNRFTVELHQLNALVQKTQVRIIFVQGALDALTQVLTVEQVKEDESNGQ